MDPEQVDPFGVNIIWRNLYEIWNHMSIFKNLIICGDFTVFKWYLQAHVNWYIRAHLLDGYVHCTT
jgi:hypothetical protein